MGLLAGGDGASSAARATAAQARSREVQFISAFEEFFAECVRVIYLFIKCSSLTAHWHDKGADWRGLAHIP